MAFQQSASTSSSAEQARANDLDFRLCEQFGVKELKPVQKEGLTHLLSGHDVLAILPTGHGKSLIYHMYPYMLPGKRSVLVVSPLVSLMKDQISTLSSFGFKAAMLQDAVDDGGELATYVFGSPEDYLKSKHNTLDMLKANHSDVISLLVIDEVHTIPKWGEKPNLSNKGRRKAQEGAFREYFAHVGELRSYFPDVKVLALTATASKEVQSQIKDNLCLHDCKVINVCPNKDNIRYSVLKIPTDIPSTLYWMVDKLREEKEDFPRTIIYCSSIDLTAKLYHYFKVEYPASVDYIGMYHSETDSVVQESHLQEMTKDTESNLRIMFCTTALGMGIDIKSTHYVIHYGPCFDLESYIQESGRVGRDGNPSHAVLFYNGKMVKDICPKLRKYILSISTCRRISLFENFASVEDISIMKNKEHHHSCCDVCECQCSCGQCVQQANFIEKHLVHYCTDTDSDILSSSSSLESDAVIDNSCSSSSDG
ncbi:uncharacterized protein [Ptychodera flava]|uniref:uncharacterized protein n=1 Tax=Ptychodera flava TaxID=63121 RepID=UPI00396A9450